MEKSLVKIVVEKESATVLGQKLLKIAAKNLIYLSDPMYIIISYYLWKKTLLQ